jgi:hypothetical protein
MIRSIALYGEPKALIDQKQDENQKEIENREGKHAPSAAIAVVADHSNGKGEENQPERQRTGAVNQT